MNDHEDEDERDDPDWEALAAEAERAEARGRINASASIIRVMNSTPLDVSSQPPGTRLVVRSHFEEEDPERDIPVEFTILDPATLKVLVRDPRHFPEPTEGTLLGSGGMGGDVTSPGQLKRLDWLIYEVSGKQYRPHFDTIRRIEIYTPGRTERPFELWKDC
jgi:hypothetical protein